MKAVRRQQSVLGKSFPKFVITVKVKLKSFGESCLWDSKPQLDSKKKGENEEKRKKVRN